MSRAVTFQEIMESKLFTFLIGEAKKPFVVHSGALAAHSAPLRTLMYGRMQEATESVATLDDVDEETLFRVCQWAYSGTYDDFQPELISDEKDSLPKGKGCAEQDDVLTNDEENELKTLVGHIPNNKVSKKRNWKQRPHRSDGRRLSFAKGLLGYARLYVFGDKYGMSDLTEHTLREYACFLRGVDDFNSDFFDDFVDAIRFIFAHTPDLKDDHDSLREIVTEEASMRLEDAVKVPSFLELLTEGGSFPRDLMLKVSNERLDQGEGRD